MVDGGVRVDAPRWPAVERLHEQASADAVIDIGERLAVTRDGRMHKLPREGDRLRWCSIEPDAIDPPTGNHLREQDGAQRGPWCRDVAAGREECETQEQTNAGAMPRQFDGCALRVDLTAAGINGARVRTASGLPEALRGRLASGGELLRARQPEGRDPTLEDGRRQLQALVRQRGQSILPCEQIGEAN